jgi:TrmH family RNA methyltransferase
MSEARMLSKQKLSSIKRLLQKKNREEEGMFILEGWKSLEEAVNAGAEIETIIYDVQKVESAKLLLKLERSAKEVFAAKTKELETISDTVSAQGIIAVLPKRSHDGVLASLLKRQSLMIVVLDGMNDPGNLGTIVRTCDWFGVDALVIGNNSVELYNPKVVRASMGSMFHLPVIDEVDLAGFLTLCRKENIPVFSTELSNSEDIRKVSFTKRSVIIIGSESHGVSPEISAMADKKIFVPQFGKAESLNAAMACGIILSHIKL